MFGVHGIAAGFGYKATLNLEDQLGYADESGIPFAVLFRELEQVRQVPRCPSYHYLVVIVVLVREWRPLPGSYCGPSLTRCPVRYQVAIIYIKTCESCHRYRAWTPASLGHVPLLRYFVDFYFAILIETTEVTKVSEGRRVML
jgi:hypothetical protein